MQHKVKNKQYKKNINDTFESIYESVLTFLEPLSTEETYKRLVQESMRLSNASGGSIYIKNGFKLQRVYTSKTSPDKNKSDNYISMYATLKTKQPVVIKTKNIKNNKTSPQAAANKSTLYIPLINRNEPIGILALDFPGIIKKSDEGISLIKAFCSIATMAIRKALLYEEIKIALEARDLFISIASHELKTPLTSIRIYSQLLNNKFTNSKKPEAKWTEKINVELSRLIMLINEFLSVENIKSDQLQYTLAECCFKTVTLTAIDQFKKINNGRVVIFNDEHKGPTEIIGDKNKLHQVISNLLDNASKFSKPNTQIIVDFKSNKQYLMLSIKDEGKGISKKEISRIFERFYKGDASATNGMGLGLFLAKNIIQYHKGKIDVHSKLNEGTDVSISLPKSVNFNRFNF